MIQCLDSIIAQTFKNIEIICINDASTDGSLSILQAYRQKDVRIQIIDKVDEGVSLARNEGLKAATGDYIMFVDADDWIEKDTCEIALNASLNQDADVVMWTYYSEHESASIKKDIFPQDITFKGKEVQEYLHRRFIGIINEELKAPEKADSLCTVWGKLYRKSIIRDNELTFPDIREIGTYEDGLFNLYAFYYVEKAVYINKGLYHYRRTNEASVTSKYKPELAKCWNRLFTIMEEYINKNKLPEAYRQALNNRIALSILGLGLNIMSDNSSAIKKIKAIKQIITSEKYKGAYKSLTLKYFPIHWKVFYGCAKFGNAIGVYLLLIAISKIVSG